MITEVSAAFGLGGVSRNGDVPPVEGLTGRLQLGERLRHGLHLVEEVNVIAGGYIAPYPTDTSEQHQSLGVGVRWEPFKPRPNPDVVPICCRLRLFDIRAFYLTAVVGANDRSRGTWLGPNQYAYDSAWSPMARPAVGLPELHVREWALGPEFREQLTYYDGRLQRGWMLTFAIHVNAW